MSDLCLQSVLPIQSFTLWNFVYIETFNRIKHMLMKMETECAMMSSQLLKLGKYVIQFTVCSLWCESHGRFCCFFDKFVCIFYSISSNLWVLCFYSLCVLFQAIKLLAFNFVFISWLPGNVTLSYNIALMGNIDLLYEILLNKPSPGV